MSNSPNLSFSLLLACAAPIVLAAPSSSAYLQSNTASQLPTGNIESGSKLQFLAPRENTNNHGHSGTDRSPSNNELPPGLTIYGTNDQERQVAMCEAGFVGACHSSIKAGKSDASQFTTDDTDTESPSALPSTGFLVATFVAFCILAMIRKSRGNFQVSSESQSVMKK